MNLTSPRSCARGMTCLIGVLLLPALTGCLRMNHDAFVQGIDQGTSRRLYDTVAGGETALHRSLLELDAQPLVFALSADGAQLVESVAGDPELLGEDRAVFYQVGDESGGIRLFYFSPRNFGIVELGQPLPPDSDLVETAPLRYAIYRSCAVSGRFRENLEVFRFDFDRSLSAPGLVGSDAVQISHAGGSDIAALPLRAQNRIVYIHREKIDRPRLMWCDLNGENTTPVWPEQEFDVRLPRLLPDGSYVIAANPDQFFKVYAVDWQADEVPRMRPASYPLPGPQSNSDVTLSIMAVDGALRPTLLELPQVLDLETLTSLVLAHDPTINQRRVEAMVAMLQSGMAKMRSWPTLSLGLEYERNSTLFVDKPELFPADLFTIGLTRGLIGFVQPVLDIRHNLAQSKSREWRARILEELVRYESNERVTEAAEIYFEAQYLRDRTGIEASRIAAAQERVDYYRKLRGRGESIRLQLIAAQQVVDNLTTEHDFHRQRLAFLQGELLHRCGLPESATIELATEDFDFSGAALPSIESARDIALLNHPRMLLADNALSEAYYLGETGAEIRPQLNVAGSFELSERRFDRVTSSTLAGLNNSYTTTGTETERRSDETSLLGLYGAYPLASHRAKQLHGESSEQTIQALRLQKEAEARATAASSDEAHVDFYAAQRDYQAKMASVSYYLEQLRVARVLKAHGPAESLLETPRLAHDLSGTGLLLQTTRLSRDFPTEDTPLRANYLADGTAEVEYLGSLAELRRVEFDMAVRFAHAWRAMGVSTELPREAARWKENEVKRRSASIWLWHTRALLESDTAQAEFSALARERGITRVYTYLYVESDVLAEPIPREKFRQFLQTCYTQGIEVWALLGEPEWLEYPKLRGSLSTAARRIREFNDAQTLDEPRIAGVKVDLEPHSSPRWDAAAEVRDDLIVTYLGLLQDARTQLDGHLPLWADIPIKFFDPAHADILSGILERVDGATLMCYINSENGIYKHALNALESFSKPLEIGVEFSEKSPENERIAGWPPERIDTFREELDARCLPYKHYQGWALHDFDAVNAYYDKSEP